MGKIRAIAAVDPPYSEPCFPMLTNISDLVDSPCPRPGLEIEILHYLLQGLLKFDVEWIQANSYNESYMALDSGRADVLGATEKYEEAMIRKGWIASSVVRVGDFILLGKEMDIDDEEVKSLFYQKTIFLQTFQWQVWVAMVVVVVAAHFFLKLPRKGPKFAGVVVFVIVNIFFSVFSNLMAIDLVIPSKVRSLPFSSLEDLGKKLLSGKCRLAIIDYYAASNYIEVLNPSHNDSYGELFRQAYKVNPPAKVSSGAEMQEFILQSSSAQCHVGIEYDVEKSRYEQSHCRIKVFKLPFFLNKQLFVYYHKLPWLEEPLNRLIATDSVSQLYNTLKSKYRVPIKLEQECDYDQERVEWSPLAISKVFSTFFVTVVSGFLLTMAMLVGELLWHGKYTARKELFKVHPTLEAELCRLCRRLEVEHDLRKRSRILGEIIDVCVKGNVQF